MVHYDETGFDALANSDREPGLLSEIAAYLAANRKWWLVPIFASLLAMGTLLALSGSVAAPFIYSLF